MEILCKTVHVVAAVFLVLVVLLQSGRGGGMGATFGGASSQIFGGRGANNFLTRVTTGAAVVFFLTSFSLSYFSSRQHSVVLRAGAEAPRTDAQAGATDGQAEAGKNDETLEQDDDKAEKTAPRDPDAPAATPLGVPSGDNP